ncbi:MAG: 30S ribosomal protein S20 [Gemmatimonadota bacterium]|jgi:small subunit ribosomal protein S20|nr:30S ribosomal protein S20 [Gemmatimonadota bacterium]MDP6529980.1 30S ribosomal protein S20 [Gemmatimonadota bacterium]MDP6802115.1 30S ribosomal protein S20 [Gemmatimonadota bacterium]MDP7032050.1 30S ribosomal protein S20 [Gemmatimonadota bacterium]
MPQHKSCEKRLRQTKTANERNRAIRSALRTIVRKFREASGEEARDLFTRSCSVLDRAASRNVIHRRQADRRKSRLALELARKTD